MKYFKWTFKNLTVPMVEIEPGHLRCTNMAIASSLGVDIKVLRKVYERHPQVFTPLSATECRAKDFLRNHREQFEIKRVRGDIKLWTPRDMLRFARYITSPTSDEFHEHVIDLIEEQAQVGQIALEEYDRLMTRANYHEADAEHWRGTAETLTAELNRIQGDFDRVQGDLNRVRSAHGEAMSGAGRILAIGRHKPVH